MEVLLHGNPVNTVGDVPQIGEKAPDFNLTNSDLTDIKLSQFQGKRVILNIFPSLDTGTCALSVKRFNQEAARLDNTVVLCISKDLPFAQKRFCGAEGIDKVMTLSEYKDKNFSDKYKLNFKDGPLKGLFSRVVLVLDENLTIIHREQVREITDEPDYNAALNALQTD